MKYPAPKARELLDVTYLRQIFPYWTEMVDPLIDLPAAFEDARDEVLDLLAVQHLDGHPEPLVQL